MNLRITPEALAQAKRIKTWWQAHRPDSPDLFEQDLDAALDRVVTAPGISPVYEYGDRDAVVQRVLLPKTRHHLYYTVDGDDVVVLSVWGAQRERPPRW